MNGGAGATSRVDPTGTPMARVGQVEIKPRSSAEGPARLFPLALLHWESATQDTSRRCRSIANVRVYGIARSANSEVALDPQWRRWPSR